MIAGAGGSGFLDGPGTTALFGNLNAIATDKTSKLLLADSGANGIRQLVSQGSFDFGTPDGSGTGEATLVNPTGFADLNGLQRPYIDVAKTLAPGESADIGEWQFSIPSGIPAFRFTVTVEAPTSLYSPLEAVLNAAAGPGSPNVVAQFLSRGSSTSAFTGNLDSVGFDSVSTYFATDRNGVVYASDGFGRVIRRIGTNGAVTLVAGQVGVSGTADGYGSTARFGNPDGISVNPEGTEIMVADETGQTIRRVGLSYPSADPTDPNSWQVTTIAGLANTSGDADGFGADARFRGPVGIAGPSNDNLFLTEYTGYRVRQIRYIGGQRSLPASWQVAKVAGTGVSGYLDGGATVAKFGNLVGATYSALGKLYVCDRGSFTIRAIDTLTFNVTTLAGTGNTNGLVDSLTATTARFSFPSAVATDASGAVYVGDGAVVRRILNGTVKTVAGGGAGTGTTGDKVVFANIYGIAINGQGDLLLNSGGRMVRLTRKIGR